MRAFAAALRPSRGSFRRDAVWHGLEPEAAAELLDSLAQRSGIELERAVVLEL